MVAREQRLHLTAGDAAVVLPDVLAHIPEEETLCLYHTYTLIQMPNESRERILQAIQRYAAET